MPTVLITGANRGLGLEFARQYISSDWHVIACCRNPAAAVELQQLSLNSNRLELMELDVSYEPAITKLARTLGERPIDVLINNAGVLGDNCANLGEMSQATWLRVLNINTVAPALLIQALQTNVIASELKTIVGISSRVASISDNEGGGMYSYRASKTALNQILKCVANDLRGKGVKTLAIHPGWVRTDMGGEKATYSRKESIAGMLKIINNLTAAQSGTFRVFDGSELPW